MCRRSRDGRLGVISSAPDALVLVAIIILVLGYAFEVSIFHKKRNEEFNMTKRLKKEDVKRVHVARGIDDVETLKSLLQDQVECIDEHKSDIHGDWTKCNFCGVYHDEYKTSFWCDHCDRNVCGRDYCEGNPTSAHRLETCRKCETKMKGAY